MWPGYPSTYVVNEAYALLGIGAFDEAMACLARLHDSLPPRYLADRVAVLRDLVALAAAEHRGSWGDAQQALLAQMSQRLRTLEWHAVLPFLPEFVARLFARPLDGGIEVEWVRAVIRFRDLKPPPGATRHWPWPVRVQVLGDFRVEGDAGPLQPHAAAPGRAASKPLDLLRLLAAHGYDGVPVDDLALALWPGDGREGRQKAFDITAARLRRLLGRDEAVLVHDRRARLNAHCVWLDLAALHQRLEQAEAATDDSAALRAALDAALALYCGPCLADRREPWADAARARVRASLAAALLLALNRDGGDRHHARVVALKCAAVDPALWPMLQSGKG